MSIGYTLSESISGFRRTKLSSFVSIFTICVALLFLGLFGLATIQANKFIEYLRSKVEMEAFLQEPLGKKELTEIQKYASNIDGVEEVEYVSKSDAAKVFKQEFGEDVLDVLDFNPLPASLKIHIKTGYQTSAAAQRIRTDLESLKGVQSVEYRKDLLEVLDQQTSTVYSFSLGLGIIIGLSAIFLVANTIRLAIYAKRKIIRTMELVGATFMFIRTPFLLEGILQGLIGGLIAAGAFYFLITYAANFFTSFSEYLVIDRLFYVFVIVAGLLLGLLGGIISVVRFIRITGTTNSMRGA